MNSKKSDKSKAGDPSKAPSVIANAAKQEGVPIDLNSDLGESTGNDSLILPYISSANIACGYHAGDEKTILQTIEEALQHQVAIGAHVSFLDKENFGRSEMNLPPEEIYELIIQQLIIINDIADSVDAELKHVKPHGALYNMAAKNKLLANAIARAVKDFNKELILFGLSGSHSISEAKAIGLKTISEVFADRTYQDDGSLTPRSQPKALIEDADKSIQQVLQMIKKGTVTSISGKEIPITAQTICIHGDGKNAVNFAKNIYTVLKKENIDIKAP
jgi:UPF0271 protein